MTYFDFVALSWGAAIVLLVGVPWALLRTYRLHLRRENALNEWVDRDPQAM